MARIDRVLEKMKSDGGRAFKLESGESCLVRFLPPYDDSDEERAEKLGATLDAGSGILVCNQHGWMPNPKAEPRDDGTVSKTNYRCMRDMGEECYICSFFNGLSIPDQKLFKEHAQRPVAIVDLWLPKKKLLKRWFTGKKNVTKMQTVFDANPKVNDERKGRNIIIKRTGTSFQTSYSLRVSEKITALSMEGEYPDILEELNNMPKLTSKEAKKVLEAMLGGKD